MKPLFLLSVIALSLQSCVGPHYICPDCASIETMVKFPSDTSRLDSVVYVEKKLLYYNSHPGPYEHGRDWNLNLNELDTISSFLFYSAGGVVDSLVFKHRYKPAYDDKCDSYFFEVEYMSIAKSTFDSVYSNYYNQCITELEIYY